MNLKRLMLCWLLLALPFAAQAQPFTPPTELEKKRQSLYCFIDSAFSAEYGEQRNALIRWNHPIRYAIKGEASPEDLQTIDTFVTFLNENIPSFPGMVPENTGREANLTLHFVPLSEVTTRCPGLAGGNWGGFSYRYNDDYGITWAAVAIATDVTTQAERNHLLQEELTGALGLTNDIYTYNDSILYQGWTTTQTLSPLDIQMLTHLYSPLLSPGMSAEEAFSILYPLCFDGASF